MSAEGATDEKQEETHPAALCPMCHGALTWPGWGVWVDCEHCGMQTRWIAPDQKAMRPTPGRVSPPDNVATWYHVSG